LLHALTENGTFTVLVKNYKIYDHKNFNASLKDSSTKIDKTNYLSFGKTIKISILNEKMKPIENFKKDSMI